MPGGLQRDNSGPGRDTPQGAPKAETSTRSHTGPHKQPLTFSPATTMPGAPWRRERKARREEEPRHPQAWVRSGMRTHGGLCLSWALLSPTRGLLSSGNPKRRALGTVLGSPTSWGHGGKCSRWQVGGSGREEEREDGEQAGEEGGRGSRGWSLLHGSLRVSQGPRGWRELRGDPPARQLTQGGDSCRGPRMVPGWGYPET